MCPYCINNEGICQQRCVQSERIPLRSEDQKFAEKLTPDARLRFELQILDQRSTVQEK